MQVAGYFAGGDALLKKYQIGEALAASGVPVVFGTLSDTHGVLKASTTAAAQAIGLTLDAQATRNTAQQTGNADPAVYVTVDVRADAIIRARLSGGSTAGTALTENSNTVASTSGLLTTLALASAYDDGYIWGAAGANAGVLRKVTAVAGTNETPIVAFPFDIAVGDTFYAATFGPAEDAGVQLTSNVVEIDATADNQSGNNFRCVDFDHRHKADRGATESYALIVFYDHMFGGGSIS